MAKCPFRVNNCSFVDWKKKKERNLKISDTYVKSFHGLTMMNGFQSKVVQ